MSAPDTFYAVIGWLVLRAWRSGRWINDNEED